MLQFPQLFFHLKPETNVILSPIFWRMNEHPLLEPQSQLKSLGRFAVFASCPLIIGVQDLVNYDKQHWEDEETGQKQEDSIRWKCPNYFCLRL